MVNLSALIPFGKKTHSVLGLDISTSSIKAVQLQRKKGQAVLETYGELALGPYAGIEQGKAVNLTPEQVGAALKDLLKEAKVTTNSCGVSIPLRSSLITVIEMPDLGEKKLSEMIPIEVRKYIPVNISEVMLDWRVIPNPGVVPGVAEEKKDGEGGGKTTSSVKKPTRPKNTVDVLVVAIHRETINRFNEIIKSAGLVTSFFEIEVFSIVRSSVETGSGPTMVLDMGAENTKLLVVEYGILRQSHIINRGAQEITRQIAAKLNISTDEAEKIKREYNAGDEANQAVIENILQTFLAGIFSEANRVLLSFEQKYAMNVGQIVLTGGGVLLRNFTEVARSAFQTPVTVANPFGRVESPAFLEDTLKLVGPEFAVAVGAALRKVEELG